MVLTKRKELRDMNKRKIIPFITCIMVVSSMVSVANDNVPTDDVIAKQIGVGPAEVIMNADSIVAILTVWENDRAQPNRLYHCMCSIVQNTLCHPLCYF